LRQLPRAPAGLQVKGKTRLNVPIQSPPALAIFRSTTHHVSCQCPVRQSCDLNGQKAADASHKRRPIKITKATIEAAWRRRKKDHRLIVRDAECRGLALVVNPTTMRWEYAYRPRGADPVAGRRWPNRTVTLGNPETHSPEGARIAANRIKGEAKAGADPAAEKKARAVVQQRQRAATLARLADEYARALPKRPKLRGPGLLTTDYVADEVAQVRLALADMKAEDMPAANLGAKHIRQLLGRTEGAASTRARFGALSRFLDWAQDAEHITVNPCMLIARSRRPRAPQARAHHLTPAELVRLWWAAERLREHVWRDLARFLIAVPCRRGEAARLEWSHLDLEAAEWRQPGRLTKNRDPHRLHLHPLAVDVLRVRQKALAEAQAAGDSEKVAHIMAAGVPRSRLVFAAPLSGKPVDTFSDMRTELVAATGQDCEDGAALDGWAWHDFRRSFATALGEAGIPEAVADAVLNHRQSATRGGVLGVYQRASRWPEQVKAMQLWGRILAAAIEGRAAVAEVVQLPARAG
jgi:integrase